MHLFKPNSRTVLKQMNFTKRHKWGVKQCNRRNLQTREIQTQANEPLYWSFPERNGTVKRGKAHASIGEQRRNFLGGRDGKHGWVMTKVQEIPFMICAIKCSSLNVNE